jgi:purine-binding chemotaxis protein CheW
MQTSLTFPKTLLIFALGKAHYAVDALRVRESVWLPELSPVEEVPSYIVGIFSLRGQIVPVTDLNVRFGRAPQSRLLCDQIVILELENQLMGLIVNEVVEVIELADASPQPTKLNDLATSNADPLVAGNLSVGGALVTLLDVSQLLRQPQTWLENPVQQQSLHHNEDTPTSLDMQTVFHARAETLMKTIQKEEGKQLELAVIELSGEFFGIELHIVQEFCDNIQPYPIPCCPPHIQGVFNLRGNLFLLLDLRAALNFPAASLNSCKAVMVGVGKQAVAVAVDQVCDVIYLRGDKLQKAPESLRELHGDEIKGTAIYGDRMMVVLDLTVLLTRDEWIVNETVE